MGKVFSLIDPATFENRLNQVYDNVDTTGEHRLVCCQVFLVIAHGLMYSVNQWSGDDGPPGFRYFQHALKFLPDIHGGRSILFVEVLYYVSCYMQSISHHDAAFLYVRIYFLDKDLVTAG